MPLWPDGCSGIADYLTRRGDDFYIDLPAPFTSEPSKHPVVSDGDGIESYLAKRYAAALGRPFVCLEDLDKLTGTAPLSVTCVPRLGAGYEWVRTLRTRLRERFNVPVPLGILTAENVAVWTWVSVKQLLQRVTPAGSVAWVDSFEEWVPWLTTAVTAGACARPQELRDVVLGASTLLMHAHSRPHCGVLLGPEKSRMGLCSSPTLGRGGMCFENVPCFFAGEPILALEALQATRLFFNGCYTARLGDDSCGLPAYAAHGFAALRGRTAEFVGNVRAGRYTGSDLLWFVALSALGYSPAEAVEVIEGQRQVEHREHEPSLVYLGDGANPAWTVAPSMPAEIRCDSAGVYFQWDAADGVVAAHLPDGDWNSLAREGRLTARVDGGGNGAVRVSVAEVPFTRQSVVLVAQETPGNGGGKLSLALLKHPSPLDDVTGSALEETLTRLEFATRIPVLKDALGCTTEILRNRLVTIRQVATRRENLADRETSLAVAKQLAAQLAYACDVQLVRGACKAAVSNWDWQEEYAPHAIFTPSSEPVVCPSCGQRASAYGVVDRLTATLRRRQVACVACAVVSDLPEWNLEIAVERGSVSASPKRLACRVSVTNHDTEAHRVALGAQIHGFAVRSEDGSDTVAVLEVQPGERLRHPVVLVPDGADFLGFTWVRTYVASGGGFGFFGVPAYFVPPQSASPAGDVD